MRYERGIAKTTDVPVPAGGLPEEKVADRRRVVADTVVAATGSTIAALPVFLVSALAVQLRESLHFDAGHQGLIVATYFLTAAVASIPLGRVVETLGGLRVIRVATAVTGSLLLVFAGAVRSWPVIVPVMLLAGASSAAMQLAANVFLARRIPFHRQGLAFGVKQSAVPLATLIAGLAVPAVALTVGWRWAFVIAGGVALVVAAVLPKPRVTLAERRARARDPALTRRETVPLVALACGFALGIAAATSLAAFLATAAVASGSSKGEAGLLVALGGAVAMLARVLVGAQADRRGGRHLPTVATMLLVGTSGYVLLGVAAAAETPALLWPGVLLAFAAGWGWNGLFNFAVVRTHDTHPAQATAITQAGGRVGGVAGPLLFGIAVTHASYAAAWIGTAVVAATSAATMLVGRQLVLRRRAAPSETRVQDRATSGGRADRS